MEDTMNVVPKVVVEEFAKSPETIEVLCRSGFENIKAQENEDGLKDYFHVKLGKGFVTYLVVGMHKNDVGQVSISLRKIKATQRVGKTEAEIAAEESAEEKAEIEAEIAELEDRLASL